MARSLLVTLLVLGASTVARAGEPQIYLSWRAAHDLPGAARSLVRTCGDTARVDTLHLSFDPGRACSTFVGMTATVWFRALDGDTLGPLWHSPARGMLPRGMTFEFARDKSSGHPFPWESPGFGSAGYVKSAPAAGRLRIVYAVLPQAGARVEGGRRYGLGHLLQRRPAAGAPGCRQPVCVEWTEATMAYRIGEEPVVSSGARFVGINAEGGDHACSAAPAPAKSGKPKSQAGGR
jgi:hypothetical protein